MCVEAFAPKHKIQMLVLMVKFSFSLRNWHEYIPFFFVLQRRATGRVSFLQNSERNISQYRVLLNSEVSAYCIISLIHVNGIGFQHFFIYCV